MHFFKELITFIFPNIIQTELKKAKQKAFREQEAVNKFLGVSSCTTFNIISFQRTVM